MFNELIFRKMAPVFRRKLYDRLLEWKNQSHGTTAMLIEGARRVGKSTLVREFAAQEYDTYIFIDFGVASPQVVKLFDDLTHLDLFFLQLQSVYHVNLVERRSVIVFDEVQKCPRARQAIKYLVADGRYDYIETGSLISIKQNVKDIIIPSEERRLSLHPMDFEEFLWATGDEVSIPLLRQFLEQKLPLAQAHGAMLRRLRLYMLVGGMPQAVAEYLSTNNLSAVDAVKRDIINLYIDDFEKIDSTGQVAHLFRSIPAQLSQNNGRYKPFAVLGNVPTDRLYTVLRDLEDSKTVVFAYQTNDPNVGMSLTANISRFKIFCADTGLFITLAFWDKDYTENVVYSKLLSDKLPINLGYIYENLVAQMLTASGNRLFFHTWAKDENHNYEIDFLLSRGAKLRPIEVKSSGYRRHASLDAFCQKYSSVVDYRYLISPKDYGKDEQTILLPIYMTPLI